MSWELLGDSGFVCLAQEGFSFAPFVVYLFISGLLLHEMIL